MYREWNFIERIWLSKNMKHFVHPFFYTRQDHLTIWILHLLSILKINISRNFGVRKCYNSLHKNSYSYLCDA